MSKDESDAVKIAAAAAAAGGAKAALDLLRLLERQRLLGDPRVRVQVPTDGDVAQTAAPSMSRRYTLD